MRVREVGRRVFNGSSVNKNTKFYSAVKYDYNLRCTSATYDTVKVPKHVTHVKKWEFAEKVAFVFRIKDTSYVTCKGRRGLLLDKN